MKFGKQNERTSTPGFVWASGKSLISLLSIDLMLLTLIYSRRKIHQTFSLAYNLIFSFLVPKIKKYHIIFVFFFIHRLFSVTFLSAFNFENSSLNDVIITRDVVESTQWKRILVENATNSIELSGCICGGAIFDEFLDLIEMQLSLKPKLQVRILTVIHLLTESNRHRLIKLESKHPNRFFSLLTSWNINLFPIPMVSENHQKILVVDEKYFLVGGSNLTDHNTIEHADIKLVTNPTFTQIVMGISMRDMDAVVCGPMASQARRAFYKLWTKWKNIHNVPGDQPDLSIEYIPLAENAFDGCNISEFSTSPFNIRDVKMSLVTCGPEDGENNSCVLALENLFDEANKEIIIGNLLFDDDNLIEHLKNAANRQVNITVITNGTHIDELSAGKRIMGMANRYNYPKLPKYFTTFYEYAVSGQVYHKKVFLIDNEITLIGSLNISRKSTACDDELLLIMQSEAVSNAVRKIFDEDISRSRRVSIEEQSSFRNGWLGWVRAVVSFLNQYRGI